MDGIDAIGSFLDRTGRDARIGPLHIALYAAILKCWLDQEKSLSITIISNDVMRMAKIFSSATYHKAIRELNDYGYISYQRANSRWEKSSVKLNSFE